MKIEMTKGKETKGTVVFYDETPNSPLSQLYIRKGAGFDKAEKITVTIEEKK